MASYKSGFDPPHRPAETSRARRLGTYMQQSAVQPPANVEHRGADIAHISGQMERRLPSVRIPQPRSRIRDPSPSTRPTLEDTRTGSSNSSFGFSRLAPAPATTMARPPPELRGKSSRNVLRRKTSAVLPQVETSRPKAERQDSSSSTKLSSTRRPSDTMQKSTETYNEIFTRPARTRTPASTEPQVYPELDRYRSKPENVIRQDHPPKLSTQDLPPANPLMYGTPVYSGGSGHSHRYSGYSGSGYSASPSTRFSESPGPGAYSRDTTPTSMSSQSPGILAPMKTTTPRLRQGSPAFSRPPPVTSRMRTASIPTESDQGLPSLRESVTSSSSNSTVKGDGNGKEKEKKKKKKKRLSPCPPSPPPRKSSQKFKKAKSDEPEESPSKPSQVPAKPVMMSPVESPVKVRAVTSPVSKTGPPSRPSRDGAPDLHAQMGIPVVQSNLTGLPQKRLSSLPMPRSTGSSQPSPTIRPPLGSRLPSRNNLSPSPILTSPREATPAPSGLGIIPDLRPQPARGISRTPSPSIANTKPRFGLFGRRTKTTPEVTTTRKGPAAGTGHEGYGKYANRGRSSSTGGYSSRGSGNFSIAASSSQESVSSTRTHDPFLLHRMSPVIIAGGGEIIENRNDSSDLARTDSNTSLLLDRGRPSLEFKGSSLSHEISRTTLWPSPMPRENSRRISTILAKKGRRPSDSSDDGVTKSSLALRRSVQRLNSSSASLGLPKPVNTSNMVISPSMTSLDASALSDGYHLEIGIAKKETLTKPKKLEKLEKKPKEARKWNFFHRAQPKDAGKEVAPAMPVSVAVGKAPKKSVPHYALMDSSDEQLYPEEINLEDLLRDAEVVGMSDGELDALQFGEMKAQQDIKPLSVPKSVSEAKPYSVTTVALETPVLFSSPEPIFSSKPIFGRPTTPPTDLHLTQEPVRVRPSRLPQVGRIPKVISARPETTSPKSFSRPFARLSTLQPLIQPIIMDKESVAVGPSPTKPSTPEPTDTHPEISAVPSLRQESIDSKSSTTAPSHHSFLAFSPRKNSEATTSSSGGLSLSGPTITAVIPAPDDPLEEDEMWDEYDDLMENRADEDTTKVPVSATSSQGMPFQYESYESRRMRKSKIRAKEKESPTLKQGPTPVIKEPVPPMKKAEPTLEERESMYTSSSVYSVDMSARLKDALEAVPSPTTPLSFTEFFEGYGDRNRNDSVMVQISMGPKVEAETQQVEDKHELIEVGMEEVEPQESPISRVNLRVGSMTVSKWLTFGHVLFSPAREWISGKSKRDSGSRKTSGGKERLDVLVVDGLGNDDWSFYAAETYPSATFHNLSPSPAHPPLPPTSATSPSSPYPLTPANHIQTPHNPLSTSSTSSTPPSQLPFKSSTIDLAILRFPPALPEATYKHLIAECKRVLRPGGYLEFSVLDLDMVNMGPRTRRAVRSLKVGLRDSKADLFIGSASDALLKAVAVKGFEGTRSCILGVPVASAVPGSASSAGVDGSGKAAKGMSKEDKHMSLTDLLHRPETEDTDADITKMVARVGRWWYGRCYEANLLANNINFASSTGSASGVGSHRLSGFGGERGSGGIFGDKAVLAECEMWGSSFKLCVGFARKASLSSGGRQRRSGSGSTRGSARGSL